MKPFDPSAVDVLALPSRPLCERGMLPHIAAVYLVRRGREILYVGQSNCLAHRWKLHHLMPALLMRKGVRVSWLATDASKLVRVERLLIDHLKPTLNGADLEKFSKALLKTQRAVSKRLSIYYRKFYRYDFRAHFAIARDAKCKPAHIGSVIFGRGLINHQAMPNVDKLMSKYGF